MFANFVKFFAVTLASFVTVNAFATSTKSLLPTDPIAFSEAKLLSVKTSALCPEGVTCIANGTVVELEFEVPCAGGLVKPIFAQFAGLNEEKLFVNAISYLTKTSLVALCAPGSSEVVELTFINKYFTEKDVVGIQK